MLYIKLNVSFLSTVFCLIHTGFFQVKKNQRGFLHPPTYLTHSHRVAYREIFFAITFFQQSFVLPLFYMFAYSNYEIIFSICPVSILVCKQNTTHLIKRRNVPMDGYRLLFFQGLQFMFSVKVFFFKFFLLRKYMINKLNLFFSKCSLSLSLSLISEIMKYRVRSLSS